MDKLALSSTVTADPSGAPEPTKDLRAAFAAVCCGFRTRTFVQVSQKVQPLGRGRALPAERVAR